MGFQFPTVTDPQTLANTLAEVSSLINEYIDAYENAEGLTEIQSATISSGKFTSDVTDATLLAQIEAGAQTTLDAISANYTSQLKALLAYVQLAVNNNIVIPS